MKMATAIITLFAVLGVLSAIYSQEMQNHRDKFERLEREMSEEEDNG